MGGWRLLRGLLALLEENQILSVSDRPIVPYTILTKHIGPRTVDLPLFEAFSLKGS